MNRPFKKLTHYFSALAVLLVASTVYQWTLTPLLEPPAFDAVPVKTENVMVPADSLAESFPEGAWQRGVCKRLQTTNGNFMLLFKNWEQTSDDRWRLWPITVVIGRSADGQPLQEPVILEAESGAEIRFTESLDMLSGNAPPIHDGRLRGIVEIKRQSQDAKRHLMIRTANVGIDNRKVWTTEAIQMMFGDARVIGRDLTLHLANATGTIPASQHAAAVLDRMELIYLDEMVVPLHDGPLWSSSQEPEVRANPRSNTSAGMPAPATLSLSCGGRVEYDFALDKLSMRSAVSLVHQISGGAEDRFDCDALELSLRDPTNADVSRDTPLDWLNQVTAYGSPATIRAPSFDLMVAAEHVDFKSADGLLIADGRTGVEIRRSGILARLTQLAYFFDPEHPQAIGNLDFYGAGLVRVDDDKVPLREASWSEQLSIKPQRLMTTDDLAAGADGEIGLWIDGDVRASFTDGGSFQASSIEGALQLKPSTDGSNGKQTLSPKWLKASNNVHLDTRAIAASTHLLQLIFVDPPPAGRHVSKPDKDKESSGSSMRQWIAQPDAGGEMTDPVARPRPNIRGDSISAELESGKQGVHARDLTVVGSVELTHSITTGGQTLPAKLTGQQLRWRDGGGDDVLQLGSGVESPARFELGDGYFVGPLIQIWPAENLIEINHAGEFRMPTAVLPSGLSGASDTGGSDAKKKITWTKAPHCRWNEAMRFDGRTATLSGGVTIEAALMQGREPWELNLSGDQLHVTLSDEVQIENVQTIRNAAVQQIAIVQSEDRPVMVQADHRAADGVLEARHILQAPKLTMMPESGKLVGSGPGWYRTWMRSPPKGPLASGSTAEIDASRELTGLHLQYHELFEGDLTAENLTFYRGVRVGVRNLHSWDETFDVAQMNDLSFGDSTLDCDQLRVGVAPAYVNAPRIAGMQVPWEMEANGGIVFRTRSDKGLLEGTAARTVYSSMKDLFSIDGAPHSGSNIRLTRPDGQPGPDVVISEMTINPRTMEIHHLRLQSGTLGALPTTTKR
tara:strand:- start:424135 stop:427191 length:3057 start_codon:yes stop_codon:yes gene_type:complete